MKDQAPLDHALELNAQDLDKQCETSLIEATDLKYILFFNYCQR